ncbi:MAG TPA: hypothetical protein ENG87_05650 [Candidatus Pacearchaeota archaeon]|nr:hypothetical protein [Candidatus Pacearchaeota archaeon]HDZ60576.1 hypothetical protein [Candidatus Pacearchaeota archaeon]
MRLLNTFFILLFLLTLVSAITIYSGESITLELEKPYDYYSIVGNSSPVELTIVQDGNNVTITPDKYSPTDSYEIIFFDSEKETITIYSGGGGGTRTIYKDRNITVEVDNYVDREVIKEVESITEVPGEDIRTTRIPGWINVLLGVLIFTIILISIAYFKKDTSENIVERRYENE